MLQGHPFNYQILELYETKSFIIIITEPLFEESLYTFIK